MKVLENPRIEYRDGFKTFKEVAFYFFNEEYADRKRIKTIHEAYPVAESYVKEFGNHPKLLKALNDFKFAMSIELCKAKEVLKH